MASPTQRTQFKLMLMKVADLLTEKNVQDLAFLCTDIQPARRPALTNARDLFAELQAHGVISEGKVNIHFGWLEEFRLHQASDHVKRYRQNFLECPVQQTEKCKEHEEHKLRYFCLTCDRKVCAECIVKSHSRNTPCDVVEFAEIYNNISALREEGTKQLQAVKHKMETTKNLWSEKKEFLSKCRGNTRREIHADYFSLQEKMDRNKLSLIKNLDEKEFSDLKILITEREEIERLSNRIATITMDINATSVDSLDELRKVNTSVKRFQEDKDKMETLEKKIKHKVVDFSYRKVANDGLFGSVVLCTLIGSVEMQEKQLLHVYDERQCNKGVRLICIDPKDPSNEYWRHLVPTDNCMAPVVMSCINLYYQSIQRVLFAVGNKVSIIHTHWTGLLHDSVKSVSSLVINDVHEGSWITSIAVHHPSNSPCDAFLISISNSSLVREYRVTGEALRIIETTAWMSSVRCVAYVNDFFAVSGLGRSNITLFTFDDGGAVKQSGTMKPPPGLAILSPACIIWSGNSWLILFVDEGYDRNWKVAQYHKTGQLIKVCAEGKSFTSTDVPVSITRWVNEGFISFADSSIKTFTY